MVRLRVALGQPSAVFFTLYLILAAILAHGAYVATFLSGMWWFCVALVVLDLVLAFLARPDYLRRSDGQFHFIHRPPKDPPRRNV